MKTKQIIGILAIIAVTGGGTVLAKHHVPKPSPNGIKFPAGYQNWKVISMSHRVDNKTVRVIFSSEENLAFNVQCINTYFSHFFCAICLFTTKCVRALLSGIPTLSQLRVHFPYILQ